MTALTRWDPFAELTGLRRALDRAFDDFSMPRVWRGESEMLFPVDLSETEDAVIVKAALPGVKMDDLDISVTGDGLTIKGEVKHEEKVERENYYRQELRYGAFAHTVPLPSPVDHDKAEAELEHGVLTVRLPKTEEVRPKSIKIRDKNLIEAKS